MCYQVLAKGTDLWKAQQVRVRVESGSMSSLEASVMDATAAFPGTHNGFGGQQLIRVKVHSTGAVIDVPRSSISPLPARAFLPGEQVCRAMWSGAEEGATVERVDSATHVTIRLTEKPHVVYSSDVFRLRHVQPLPAEISEISAAPEEASATAITKPAKAVDIIDNIFKSSLSESNSLTDVLASVVRLMERLTEVKSSIESTLIDDKSLDHLKELVSAQFNAALAEIKENPAAVPGKPLFKRFKEALASTAGTHELKFLLHGTAERNVDSVLAEGLRTSPRHGTTRWFTTCVDTSDQFAKGAQRRVVFAVLVDKQKLQQSSHVYTINEASHHLPLFVARRRVVKNAM